MSFLLCLCLTGGFFSQPAYAAVSWPSNLSISADAGIVMDADTGAVLYEKNSTLPYYPASITKILTALIIIENCNLDDMVTFSHTAVHNVESGSSSAGLEVGDRLTVRDCLYAMLLKSANEAANALAEHASGSIEAFSAVMNAKAAFLGCTSSHFANPSGLNNPYHYTSARDMALISQAAFANETFVAIDSSLYYDLPASKNNPDGLRVYPGHRMMKRNMSQYYPGIIGGKTGYTSLAGNTLITCAERNGMKLITVILNGHQTHYTDTKSMLDFGFANFHSLDVADLDTTYSSITNDMAIGGLPVADLSILHLQRNCGITLPVSADFADVTSEISYELPDSAPADSIARITYAYGDHQVGATYLMHNALGADATEAAIEVTSAEDLAAAALVADGSGEAGTGNPSSGEVGSRALLGGDGSDSAALTDGDGEAAAADSTAAASRLPKINVFSILKVIFFIILALAVIGGILIGLRAYIEKKEMNERAARYERRKERLQDMNISHTDFDMILENKRASSQGNRKTFFHRK